jgi:hypothetical protein
MRYKVMGSVVLLAVRLHQSLAVVRHFYQFHILLPSAMRYLSNYNQGHRTAEE